MSVFDRLDAMVNRTVDRINATAFIIRPMRAAPNGRPSPDPERQVIEGTGIFDYADADISLELGNRTYDGSNDLRSLVAGRVLSVDLPDDCQRAPARRPARASGAAGFAEV